MTRCFVGFGSILSPSGDEDGSISDQELLRSPLSLGSCKGSRDGINTFDDDTLSSSPAPTDGETDYIDVDVDLSSPTHEHNKGMLSLPPPRVSSTTNKEAHKKKVGNTEVHVLRFKSCFPHVAHDMMLYAFCSFLWLFPFTSVWELLGYTVELGMGLFFTG